VLTLGCTATNIEMCIPAELQLILKHRICDLIFWRFSCTLPIKTCLHLLSPQFRYSAWQNFVCWNRNYV